MPSSDLVLSYSPAIGVVVEKYETTQTLNPIDHIVLPFFEDLYTVSFEPAVKFTIYVDGRAHTNSCVIGGQSHFLDLGGVSAVRCHFTADEPLAEARVLINESMDATLYPSRTYLLDFGPQDLYTESIMVAPNDNSDIPVRLYNRAWGILSSTGDVSFERFHNNAAEDLLSDQSEVIVNGECTVRLNLYGKTYLELRHAVPGPLEIMHHYYVVHQLE